MENNIEEQSGLTPPLKAVVVNGKKKIAVGGVVNLDIPEQTKQQQADWNQNDENAPDYIKNRICKDGDLLVEETTDNNMSVNKYSNSFTLEDGQTYFISCSNGVVSMKKAVAVDDGTISMSLSLVVGGGVLQYNPNGLPSAPNGETSWFFLQSENSDFKGVAVSIFKVTSIDPKFIPIDKILGGVQFKVESDTLKVSLNGSLWKTVTLT